MGDIMGTLTMTAATVAAKLEVSTDFVYRRVQSGEWPCTRLGRKVRFTDADVADILDICRSDAKRTSVPRRRKAS